MDPTTLPPDFAAEIRRIDYGSASLQINVALEGLPDFTACPGTSAGGSIAGRSTSAPIKITSNAASTTRNTVFRRANPSWNATLPSAVDPTVAPPGKYLMSMFCRYAPYALVSGTWDDARKDAFAGCCFDVVERYAPGSKRRSSRVGS